jgi:hypothetical protein
MRIYGASKSGTTHQGDDSRTLLVGPFSENPNLLVVSVDGHTILLSPETAYILGERLIEWARDFRCDSSRILDSEFGALSGHEYPV